MVVGTTGRVGMLVNSGALVTDHVKCLVLDEADSLLLDSFRDDTVWLHSVLPPKKQVPAYDASFACLSTVGRIE